MMHAALQPGIFEIKKAGVGGTDASELAQISEGGINFVRTASVEPAISPSSNCSAATRTLAGAYLRAHY